MLKATHSVLGGFCILITPLCFPTLPASANQPLIETWDNAPALANIWRATFHGDVQQWVDTTNNELHMIVRPYIPLNGQSRSRLRFPDPTSVQSITTSITIKSINHTIDMEDTSAQISGIFYNLYENKPDGAVGDVFAALRVGNRGNGLEAWLFVAESANAEFTEDTNSFEVSLADNLSLDTPYSVTFSFDGDDKFTGTISGPGLAITSKDIYGSLRIGAGSDAFFNNKELRARVWSESGLTSNPDTNKLHAVFGPVSINGGAAGSYDPFTTNLQSSLWREQEGIATVTGSQLKLQVKSADSEPDENRIYTSVNVPSEYDAYTFVQADLKIDDNPVDTASRAEIQLIKSWGNGLHANEGEPDPNYAGEIKSYFTVKKNEGEDSYMAGCYFEMDDPNNVINHTDPWVLIIGHSWVGVDALPNTYYTFSAKRDGTSLYCSVKEKSSGKLLIEENGTLEAAGINNFYELAQNQWAKLRARVRNNHPAEAIGYVDNICIATRKAVCPGDDNILLMLPAIMSRSQESK